jgi:hypothetical protein
LEKSTVFGIRRTLEPSMPRPSRNERCESLSTWKRNIPRLSAPAIDLM